MSEERDLTFPTGLDAMPGCNPVQGGPGRATPATGCGATTEIGPGGPAAADPAPAVSPPGGAPPASGGGGTVPPAVGGGGGGGGGAAVAHYGQCGGYVFIFLITCIATC